jgi:acetylornithine deacetylase/succinyl-diaminopimelate desuccinylase-like protein
MSLLPKNTSKIYDWLLLYFKSIMETNMMTSLTEDIACKRGETACSPAERFSHVSVIKEKNFSSLVWSPEDSLSKENKKSPLVFTAHSDTVFMPELRKIMYISREAQNKGEHPASRCIRMSGPGTADNTYSMAFGLCMFRILSESYTLSEKSPFNTMELVFTRGEEGAGCLKGIKQRLSLSDKRPGLVIALEGTCRPFVSSQAWFIKRQELTVSGCPGRSSRPSVIDAAAAFISGINRRVPSKGPKINIKKEKGDTSFNLSFTGIKSPFLYNASPEKLKLNIEIRAFSEKGIDSASKVIDKELKRLKKRSVFFKNKYEDFVYDLSEIDFRPGGKLFDDTVTNCPANQLYKTLGSSFTKDQNPVFHDMLSSSDANACILENIPGLALFIGDGSKCHSKDENITIDEKKDVLMIMQIINSMEELGWIKNTGRK